MKTIYEKINSNIEIHEDTTLHGMIVGNVIIDDNSSMVSHGMIIGNIEIHKNSELIVYGIVNGHIINEGSCRVFGTINGTVTNDNGGELVIDPNAKVNPL